MAHESDPGEPARTGPACAPAGKAPGRGGIDVIVVGYDGSEEAAAAVRWAGELARHSSSTLRVVWAWKMTDLWSEAMAAHPDLDVPPLAEFEALAHRRLDGLVAELVGGLVSDIDIHPVQGADAAAVLLGAATNADILAVGSRGHGRVATAVVGSVSARCIREATCPVLVIPHPMVAGDHIDPRTVQAELLARSAGHRGWAL